MKYYVAIQLYFTSRIRKMQILWLFAFCVPKRETRLRTFVHKRKNKVGGNKNKQSTYNFQYYIHAVES